MSYDEQIVDAENTLMLYQRYMREIPAATVPRQWVETLLEKLELVLDKHAELSVSFEDPDIDEDPFLDPDDDYIDQDDFAEPDEDFDDPWPFTGDGDHSDSRGNG